MTDHFKRIYRERADAFHRMVMAEDCDGHLVPAMASVIPLEGIDIVEIGVGTGRLAGLMIAAGANSILGIDEAPEMLQVASKHIESAVAQRHRAGARACTWRLETGDCSSIPAPDGAADLALAGWVFGHLTEWFEDAWQSRLARALEEFARVTRDGGAHIIFDTLGTGFDRPAPPTAALAAYYRELEDAYGFQRIELATDYLFDSVEDAAETCGFFFGEAFAATIREKRWARVPEWTGLWWRRV